MLRLLTAYEVLEARREAERMAQGDRERALCSNACLLARALVRRGKPVYKSGEDVLKALTPGEIERLTKQWAEKNRAENPSPEDGEGRVEARKKAWSTRLMSAFNGACSELLGRCPPRSGRRK